MATDKVEQFNTPRKKRSVGKLVKLGVSLLLAAFVYYTVDRKGLLHALKSFHWKTTLLLVVLYIVGQLLSALKWKIFVEEVGIKRSKLDIFRAYFFGMFVNVFGFGTVGGDVARGLVLNPPRGERAAALATVVADRVHGLWVILTIGTLTLCFIQPQAIASLTPFLIAGGISGVVMLLVGWLVGPKVLTFFIHPGHRWSDAVLRVAFAFPKKPVPMLKATIISIIFHNTQLFMHILIARELGAALSNSYIYATVPYVNIVSSLPISVMNGLGVREAMYRMLFVPNGIPAELAVAFGAIWLLIVTVVSSFGILFLTPDMKKIVRKENISSEEGNHDSPSDKSYGRQAQGW